MSNSSNTFRRGAVYWWRRTLFLRGSEKSPINLALSLLTKELSIARGRAAAMTAHSEMVRMSLYQRIAQQGLTQQQQKQLFASEMRLYRDALLHEVARWHADPELQEISDSNRDLQIFESLWSAFASTGVNLTPSLEYAERNFVDLTQDEQGRLRDLVLATPNFDANFRAQAAAALARLGIEANPVNLPLGMKIVLQARAQGARLCRLGLIPEESLEVAASPPPEHDALALAKPIMAEPPIMLATVPAAGGLRPDQVPLPWRNMTPTQVAERFIGDTPKMFEHRQSGKRASAQTDEQTLRQIRWAATLFEKSTPPGQPFWQASDEDLKTFDQWLDRLPVSYGKAPFDREKSTMLEQIEQRALERLEEGDLDAAEIGLTVPTANKHYRKIAQVHEFLREKVPGLPELNIKKFVQPDQKDERAARLRYSQEQGRAIFSLPPWMGCVGEHDRLTPGKSVVHDSLFYVLLLVWYTGARREEICKLRIADVDQLNGIWFLRIEWTETGRVKNNNSVRCIPLADELIRLGFVHYVQALEAAGDGLVFPELAPAPGKKRKRGDVFYKLWWIYVRPLVPDLKRGQAMHSARHAVSDELKQQGIFVEFRNDLLGQQSAGGEGATRYPSPTALETVLDLVNRIPIVTSHLPDANRPDIRLLSADARRQRSSRKLD